MKFKKRNRPADFGAPQHEDLAETHAAAHWADPRASEPSDDFHLETEPFTPAQPPGWHSPLAAVRPSVPVRQEDDDHAEAMVEADSFEPPPGWPIYLTAFA